MAFLLCYLKQFIWYMQKKSMKSIKEILNNNNHLCSVMYVEKNCDTFYTKKRNSTEKAFYQCHFNDFMYEFILMEIEVNEI